MEVADKKGQEPVSCSMSSPKEMSSSLKLAADNNSETFAKENGGLNGNAEKKEEEKGNEVKEETVKSAPPPNKQAELGSGKQNQTKAVEPINKKTSREEKHSRRKDERSVEQVMRSLNSFESPQEKLDALVKKYAEVADENRKLQTQAKNIERRLTQVEREKDSAQSEHSKAVLTRSRLEGLCRELQRQNRAIKEESVLKIREEEEKRKEVSNKFQSTLAEITSLMQQNNEKNSKLRDDNIEMTTKFKSVCEQYELRVQQVEKISKQMQLEAQLADAKLAKAQLEAKAEKEILLRDKHELLMELAQNQARAKEQQEVEIRLREQVDLYTKKYDEFQSALSRSNEVFGGFKEEMDRMSKKIVKLEKETSTWKQRWEKSHQALLEMATDKQQRDAELSLANRQLNQLHKLCRTLTEERAKLMAQINAIEAPTDAAKDDAKEEKLAADIAEDRRKLNDTLDSLQSVIKERELLHKQQQLEKQQLNLQVELQKHIVASATEQKGKPSDVKTSEKVSESKTNDSKQDAKVNGNKNSEASKKKGKKQKTGRQCVEKPTVSEESKVEAKEKSLPALETTDVQSSGEGPVIQVAPLLSSSTSVEVTDADKELGIKGLVSASQPAPETDTASIHLISEAAAATSNSASEAKAVSPQSTPCPEPVAPEVALVADTLIPIDSDTELVSSATNVTQTASEMKASPQPIPMLLPESTSAPSAFSYAAAVGSKPAEQPSTVDQYQNEKTEATCAVSESGTSAPMVTNETISNTQTTIGITKSVVSEALISKPEEVMEAASSPVSSTKKGKRRVGQPQGIKGRTVSLFRISKLFGCLKRPSKATQTHDTS